jgi:hypothetical protein
MQSKARAKRLSNERIKSKGTTLRRKIPSRVCGFTGSKSMQFKRAAEKARLATFMVLRLQYSSPAESA